MKSYLHINGKTYKIESYKTKDELEYLEYLFIHSELTEEDKNLFLNEFLTKNGIDNVDDLSEVEKIALLLKIREITIGDEIKIRYKCSHCCRPTEGTININNIIKLAEIFSEELNGFYSEDLKDIIKLEDITTNDYIGNLDLDEYNEITKNITKYIDTYNFTQTCKCEYCGKENYFDMSNKTLLFSFLSDETFDTLSKLLHILVYNGRLSRHDALEMTPLQRVLEYSILDEIKKEMERKRANSNNTY